MRARCLVPILALCVVSACVPLTAERPLFSPSDQAGSPPLAEGLWIQVGPECAYDRESQGPIPDACLPVELSRLDDGAWLYRTRAEPQTPPLEAAGDEWPSEWRFIVSPATERRLGNDYAPLYIAEYLPLEVQRRIRPQYAVIVPVGEYPVHELRVIMIVDCADALRDGPIRGVRDVTDVEGARRTCIADTQRAVREAGRRVVIERLSGLFASSEGTRWVWLRPQLEE